MESAKVVTSPEVERQSQGTRDGRDRVIVLPEAASRATVAPRTPLADALAREFDGVVERTVVERVTAAARHALERSRVAATPEAVERLARERLRAHADARRPARRRH